MSTTRKTITVTDQQDAWIKAQIAAGRFTNDSEYIRDLIRKDQTNNASLVEQANMGKVVVRLKGGDPFIFGRGAEEALHLVENKIPFEVVSGVNAADGCCASLGIPLTHRGIATNVRFLTGHQQKGQAMDLDWTGLAKADTTLVIYMGLTNLEEISQKLQEHGLASDTPVAAIENGTLPNQRKCISTLKNIYQDVKKAELKAPTLIVIGKVVSLSEKISI
ncbi:uroporphyrinogen-III C-methyltransferase [Rickettsiales bacterium]|nr:uroporphyrinogen-III C-methyltransferase [Rickettsiales bacterium]